MGTSPRKEQTHRIHVRRSGKLLIVSNVTKHRDQHQQNFALNLTIPGAQVGNVITLPLSGILCEYGFDDGWGSIFYVFGIILFSRHLY